MPCSHLESQIVAMFDGALPDSERPAVQQHIDACVHCRAFAKELEKWDAVLSREVVLPPLSPLFDARLRARIVASGPALSAVDIEARKRQICDEYQAGLRRLEAVWRAPSPWLELAGTSLLIGLALHWIWSDVADWGNVVQGWGLGAPVSMVTLLLSLLVAGWVSAQIVIQGFKRVQEGLVIG